MTPADALALAEAALAAIEQIVAAVQAAKSGAVDPQTAIAAIASLTQALAANNAAADAALAKRFSGP